MKMKPELFIFAVLITNLAGCAAPQQQANIWGPFITTAGEVVKHSVREATEIITHDGVTYFK